MFIEGSLTLASLACSSTIAEASKAAWRLLRYEIPELAVSAGYGEDGNAYMQYEIPRSDKDVHRWVEKTCFFECGKQRVDFEDLVNNVRQKKREHDSEQVFLLLHSVVEKSDDLVKRIDFILNADHQITDGIGIRILIGRFLALLAQSLNLPLAAQEGLDWQQSVTNLSPPWINLVNEEQRFSGPDYERVAKANEEFLFRKMVSQTFISMVRFYVSR